MLHYIIMSSSYTQGTRIAIQYILNDDSDYKKCESIVPYIMKKCGGDVSISVHFIPTKSETWKSVYEYDAFFKDVKLIDNVDDFIKIILVDRKLKGTDVANYIVKKVKCSHLKLEKLVYLAYAEYLCKYDKELFTDKIYSYRYGPVVETVYEKYKNSGSYDIKPKNKDPMPALSRITFAEDGLAKIYCINAVIEKYGKLSASELVELTHRKDAPWAMSGGESHNKNEIKDEIIKKYHHNETIE